MPEPLAADGARPVADQRQATARSSDPAGCSRARVTADRRAITQPPAEARRDRVQRDRRAALLHLAGEIPAAILADIVGIHVNTAGNWADMAGRTWVDYPTLRAR